MDPEIVYGLCLHNNSAHVYIKTCVVWGIQVRVASWLMCRLRATAATASLGVITAPRDH